MSTRARQILGEAVPLSRDDAELRRVESDVREAFEKISLEPNFLPASFLEEGARRARAVCRIPFVAEGRQYVGSGFLVAPGVILTNNHVLENEVVAANAKAEFFYEDGKEKRTVGLLPERLFYTFEPLDFSLVACEANAVSDIEPISLGRNTLEIAEQERVNIIQHPAGRPKEVVLQDNKVLRVLETLVYYEADTEGGSSGSPVFDNDWNLVGLHHWGRNVGRRAENRAIRIPSIVAHLEHVASGAVDGETDVRPVLDCTTGVNPLLGFFDSAAVAGLDPRELQVGGWAGSADFIDVGFWNIENFNDRVGRARMEAVAEVVGDLRMDVFGLVEVQSGALDRLVSELSDLGVAADYVVENAPGSQDIAVLFDEDTSSVRKRDDLVTRYRPILGQRTQHGTVFPRWPLFAECTVNQDGEDPVTFLMIVVHLKAYTDDHPSRERRRAASAALREIIDDFRSTEDLPVILGGDFNEFLTNDVLSSLTDAPDLFALTADDATGDAASYIGGRYRSLIDHIVVSNDVRLGDVGGDDAAIVRLDWSAADFDDTVSDHVPVVMRVTFGEGQPARPSEGHVTIPGGASSVKVEFLDPQGRVVGTEQRSLARADGDSDG